MSVTIKLRFVRHSAKKLRPMIRAFKGKKVDDALNSTSVIRNDSAQFLHKALKMARSSAEAKEFTPADLVIGEIFATEGPRIKRMRPNARGRSNRYQKQLAHLTVTVVPAKPAAKRRAKKETAKEVA